MLPRRDVVRRCQDPPMVLRYISKSGSIILLIQLQQYPAMQWRLDVSRHDQTHLGTYFLLSLKLDASRHFLANILLILDHILHLNFTDCFGGKGFALDANNGSQTLSKPFLVLCYQVLYTWTRITNASRKEEPRHFLIYHYITENICNMYVK